MSTAQPVLLDCTRMVARHLSGARPTGIDRVADAYRTHFAARAQAVIQVRGRARVLSRAQSERLFTLLDTPGTALRQRFAMLAHGLAAVLEDDRDDPRARAGALYLNVTHTDFDLAHHVAWLRSNDLRPVYLLHDLIPIEHPQFTTPHKVARHSRRVHQALEAATGIIANSRTTASAIAAFARSKGLNTPPILGAPLGTPPLPLPTAHAVPPRPTFVCVSTIEQRKNHMLLLDVWRSLVAQLGENAPRLVLIGRWGVHSQAVRKRYRSDPQLRRFVTICTDCSDAEVVHHLSTARAMLAPSRAEGFGLPVVEALNLGVPVIASDLPVFREVGGGVPTFLDRDAPEAWLRTIADFMTDGAERERQLSALAGWTAPDWRDHFALVEDWFQTLPARRSSVSAPLQAEVAPRPALAGGLA
jgi:glycosyltransferase involved in cell wall biosynthesis